MNIIVDEKEPLHISREACELMERFRLPFLFGDSSLSLDLRNIVSVSRESMSLLIEYLEGHTDASSYYFSEDKKDFCDFDKKFFSQFDSYIFSSDDTNLFTSKTKEYLDKWIDLYLVMMTGYFDSTDHPLVESLAFKIGSLKIATKEELQSLFGEESIETKSIIEKYEEEQVKKLLTYITEDEFH